MQKFFDHSSDRLRFSNNNNRQSSSSANKDSSSFEKASALVLDIGGVIVDDGSASTPPRRRPILNNSADHRLKSPSFDAAPFIRSFVDGTNVGADIRDASPIPALRHANLMHDRHAEGSSATLGKLPKQKSLDISAVPLTNARLRGGATSRSFRGHQPQPPPPPTLESSAPADDAVGNLPRRHKSFERPLEVRHAHITPLGASPKPWKTVEAPSNGSGTGGDESPVWKSHDSGIKSCESGLR